ncbi:MAG: hypothetical protein AAFX99_21890 [Myxococcota bacterium]
MMLQSSPFTFFVYGVVKKGSSTHSAAIDPPRPSMYGIGWWIVAVAMSVGIWGCQDAADVEMLEEEGGAAQGEVEMLSERSQRDASGWRVQLEKEHSDPEQSGRESVYLEGALSWIAAHCQVDEIGLSGYSKAWMAWIQRDELPLSRFKARQIHRPFLP